MAALGAATRAAIVEDLKAGKSHNGIAKAQGVHQSTVSRVALAEGIPSVNAAPKKALTAKVTYDLERRQQFSDQLFEQLKLDLKRGVPTKDVIMGFAILTDKRRLEEGRATERHDHHIAFDFVAFARIFDGGGFIAPDGVDEPLDPPYADGQTGLLPGPPDS